MAPSSLLSDLGARFKVKQEKYMFFHGKLSAVEIYVFGSGRQQR